ncbi:hypothetical protein CANDROIZ_200011 [Candidatus Roizmanbacteria bacterium]|nr:hypothetical protein CANDROIZ_200011 [Candidatus Roizmanbacteria bacterium]
MANPDTTKYYGITLGNFPIAAVIVTKTPAVSGDFQSEYAKPQEFNLSAEKGRPAHTSVAIGLLGIKIPLRK